MTWFQTVWFWLYTDYFPPPSLLAWWLHVAAGVVTSTSSNGRGQAEEEVGKTSATERERESALSPLLVCTWCADFVARIATDGGCSHLKYAVHCG